jgi:NitT/TauT family transport system substrate-binding protein
MGKFRIIPHMRLQEWVAEEKRYFADEGLDYEFVPGDSVSRRDGSVQAGEETSPAIVKQGAFESMEAGRACNVSTACHWAVNMAASARHGRMWGHAYSVTPCGIMVPADSPIKQAKDLAGVEVGVGYHSGSHFTTMQTLAKYMPADSIKLQSAQGEWYRQ